MPFIFSSAALMSAFDGRFISHPTLINGGAFGQTTKCPSEFSIPSNIPFVFISSLLALLVTGQTGTGPKFSHPERIRYDGHCFTIEGKDTFLFSGAFHYFRCPKELWRERFKAIKAAGFNAVETYAPWNYSELNKPKGLNDFSQVNLSELDEWMTMAEKEFGLYTIVRPGPYICAEWATGGYPNWLLAFKPEKTKQPLWFRSDDPTYLDWCRHWYRAVTKVVVSHQLTKKKPGEKGMILFQLENEYGEVGVNEAARRGQVTSLMKFANEGGIEIPYFGCWTGVIRDPKGDPLLTQAFDTPNIYCRWNIQDVADAIRDQHNAQPWAPKMVTELQGGWFGEVGGLASEEQDGISGTQISSLTLYAIQNGLTSLNYYMLFGGTNFGDWAGKGITTCYDYFAPIREWGGTGPKYRKVQAIGNFLKRHGSDIARSNPVQTSVSSDKPNVTVGALQGKSGATYLFVRNTSRTEMVTGELVGGPKYTLEPFAMNVFRFEKSALDGAWQIEEENVAHSHLRFPSARLKNAEQISLEPANWRAAPEHPTNVNLGVYDSQFIQYRSKPAKGTLWMQVAAGDLISADGVKPERRPGGFSYAMDGKSKSFLLLNPGWSNGGADMERPRGIFDARIVAKMPVGMVLSKWEARQIPNDQTTTVPRPDRTDKYRVLEANEGTQSMVAARTTWDLRTKFTLTEKPKDGLVLNFGGIDDEGWIYLNGKLVGDTHDWAQPWSFNIADKVQVGQNELIVIVRNNDGGGGLNGPATIAAPISNGKSLGFDWTNKFVETKTLAYDLDTNRPLARLEHPHFTNEKPANAPLLVRSRITFANPNFGGNATEIVLDAGGDGFLMLNGHGLGRYWEVGPQRAYYIPRTWLKANNVLEYTATPGRSGFRINAAEIRALAMVE